MTKPSAIKLMVRKREGRAGWFSMGSSIMVSSWLHRFHAGTRITT